MTSQATDHGNGVHFFKVIFESNIREGKLRVPKSFVRRYWQEISPTVVLRLANGTEWKVYWLKQDGDVWFRNGWEKFSEYLSLKESQFLVFRYEGKSKFNVIVLDPSGLEINYPSSSRSEYVDNNEGLEKGYESDDCSLEILDEKRMPRFPSPYSSQTRKKMKRSPKEEPQSYNVHPETKHGGKRKQCAPGFDISNHMNSSDISEDFDDRIKKFHESVRSSIRSDKDFFTSSLKRTYIERDRLVIPNEFAKPVLHLKEGDVTLFVVNQKRAWDVKLKRACKQLTFTSGWKKFLADNNLTVGDVCVFELINCREVSFRVHIYRFVENSSSPGFQGLSHHKPSSSYRNHETPKANKFMNSKNSFIIEMKHATSVQCATIPMDFIKNYTVRNGAFAILRDGKRTWSVKILYYPINFCARFSQGWSQFVRDCNLVEGDFCRFETMNEETHEFRVSIIKGKLN